MTDGADARSVIAVPGRIAPKANEEPAQEVPGVLRGVRLPRRTCGSSRILKPLPEAGDTDTSRHWFHDMGRLVGLGCGTNHSPGRRFLFCWSGTGLPGFPLPIPWEWRKCWKN